MKPMKWLLVLLALAAGVMVPVQAGINVRLKTALGDARLAALVSFLVGTMALAVWAVLARVPMPTAQAAGSAPWWAWTGGILGAVFVAATILLTDRIGAAGMSAWIIAAQLLAGVALDHYGMLGLAVREASPMRLVGVALLLAGAILVHRS